VLAETSAETQTGLKRSVPEGHQFFPHGEEFKLPYRFKLTVRIHPHGVVVSIFFCALTTISSQLTLKEHLRSIQRH
jgi:hypothetical protein